MPPATGVLVFEGGRGRGPKAGKPAGGPDAAPAFVLDGSAAGTDPEDLLTTVRDWTTLDTLEKFTTVPGVDQVVLVTDSDDLAARARPLEVGVHHSAGDFHFGRMLASLIEAYSFDRVVCLGGGSVPLLGREEIEALLQLTPAGEMVFTANNVQSPDIVALGRARLAARLDLPRTDNAVAFALGDAGFTRRLLPDTTTASFDLDTPMDVLFLAHEVREGCAPGGWGPRAGPRTVEGLLRLDLDLSLLDRAAAVLAGDYRSVTLIGRVSGGTMNHLNSALLVRLRVFSEERGMKALGRVENREARSLIGRLVQDFGPEYVVARLEEMSDAVFWDTRVVMAQLGGWPDDRERFHADLGQWEKVSRPELRRLCRAVRKAGVPVVTGGHSVVAGGLRLLADRVAEACRSLTR